MNWKKLKPQHYFKEPVEHIYATAIVDIKEYDSLYENQNNLSHQIWQDVDTKYKIGFEFFKIKLVILNHSFPIYKNLLYIHKIIKIDIWFSSYNN